MATSGTYRPIAGQAGANSSAAVASAGKVSPATVPLSPGAAMTRGAPATASPAPATMTLILASARPRANAG